MLAIISNFSPGEFMLVLVVAILIFGRRLPEVAAKAAVQIQRARRGVADFRRETGFDDEIRKARQVMEDPIKIVLQDVNDTEEKSPMPRPLIAPHPRALAEEQAADEDGEEKSG